MPHFSSLLFLKKFQRHVHSLCVCGIRSNKTNAFKQDMIRYIYIYIYDRYSIKTHEYVFLFSVKKACLNYREFDLEGDLVGVPHTWHLSAQSFLRLLKLV